MASSWLQSAVAPAEECTAMWDYLLDTDPNHPKLLGGDTQAAYASFSFWGDPTKKFVLTGEFPKARFFSAETNDSRWGFKIDAIFDQGIEPDLGSDNPYRLGADLNRDRRNYTLEVLPEGVESDAKNKLRIKASFLQQSVLFRIYAPFSGTVVTPSDIPRIHAFDVVTGRPTSCPRNAPVKQGIDLPQVVTLPIPRDPEFTFFDVKVPWGPNSAIPYYVGGATRTRSDDVAIIRFTPPTFALADADMNAFNDEGQVRYWSFCSGNFVKLITLACLPDHLAKVSAGEVTIVFGRGNDLKAEAERRGFNFLEDTREASQPVAEFVYRNILPKSDFAATLMYQNDYRPTGKLCARAAFMSGRCY